MNQQEKVDIVSELAEKFKSAKLALLASYQGLTVAKTNALRREIRSAAGDCLVTKNTLTKRAIQDTAFAGADRWLEGQTTLVFGFEDPIAVARIVARWAEVETGKFAIKGGVFEGEVLEPSAVVALSKTPSKEVLRAQLLGVLQAPAGRLVRTLAESGAQLARLLAARGEALEKSNQA